MRTHIPLTLFAAALFLSGCTIGGTKPPKKAEAPTTTTTSTAKVTTSTLSPADAISAARKYLRVIVADDIKSVARDEKALAAAPVMTQQSSNAYTQFANDILTFQSRVASYNWPRSAASDARKLVSALSAVAADFQQAASGSLTPNYNRDNDTEIADLQLLSADLKNL